MPPFAYYFIGKLCSLKLVRSIITTNYDSYLTSIFKKDRTLPNYVINPVLRNTEVDHSGFRSFHESNILRIFSLHGSFDWAQFKNCHCIVNLPSWVVGTNLWRVPKEWGGVVYHDYDPLFGHKPLPTGEAQHYIDWLVGREPFRREIDGALREINWAVKRDGHILLLGFRGTHCPRLPTWDEEISEPIADAAEKIPTLMVLTEPQAEESKQGIPTGPTSDELSWLIRELSKKQYGSVEVSPNIDEWFLKTFKGSVLDPKSIQEEYIFNWIYKGLFLRPREFEGNP